MMSDFENSALHYLHRIAELQEKILQRLNAIEAAVQKAQDPDQAAREARVAEMKRRAL